MTLLYSASTYTAARSATGSARQSSTGTVPPPLAAGSSRTDTRHSRSAPPACESSAVGWKLKASNLKRLVRKDAAEGAAEGGALDGALITSLHRHSSGVRLSRALSSVASCCR